MHRLGTPAKRGPGMRLSIPGLRDRNQIGVAIVVESNHPTEGVGKVSDGAAPVVIHREIIAVAIFYLNAAILVIEPGIAQLCSVRRAHHQAARVDQLQIRRISRFINVRRSDLPQFDAAAGGLEQIDVYTSLGIKEFLLNSWKAKPKTGTGRAIVFIEVDIRH